MREVNKQSTMKGAFLSVGQVITAATIYYLLTTQVSYWHVSNVETEAHYSIPVGVAFGGMLMFGSILAFRIWPELKWTALACFVCFLLTVCLTLYAFPIKVSDPLTWLRPITGVLLLLLGGWTMVRMATDGLEPLTSKAADTA